MQVVESYGILNPLSEMTAKALCPQRRRLLLTGPNDGKGIFLEKLPLPGRLRAERG